MISVGSLSFTSTCPSSRFRTRSRRLQNRYRRDNVGFVDRVTQERFCRSPTSSVVSLRCTRRDLNPHTQHTCWEQVCMRCKVASQNDWVNCDRTSQKRCSVWSFSVRRGYDSTRLSGYLRKSRPGSTSCHHQLLPTNRHVTGVTGTSSIARSALLACFPECHGV